MRCLIAAILILATVIGTAVAAWMWRGWLGLALWFGGGFVLLWLIARFGPAASQAVFRRVYAKLAEGMRDATIRIHSIEPAVKSDPVEEFLDGFDDWVRDPEIHEDGLHFAVGEYMSHCETRLDLDRYLVDFTVTPPADNADVKWSPHGFSLVPEGEPDAGRACEILNWEDYEMESGRFGPSNLKEAFEEISGERRLRILVALDPEIRVYRFEYLHSIRYAPRVTLPSGTEQTPQMRRLTEGVLDRIENARRVQTVELGFLPIDDSDIERLSGLTELEYLGLDGTEITDTALRGLARISSLQQLSLDGTRVTDSGLQSLTDLTNLQRLFVRDSSVTKRGADDFRKTRPDVKVFH